MEQTVCHVRPEITEEPLTKAGLLKYIRIYLGFVDVSLVEHSSGLSELEIKEIGKAAFKIAARCEEILKRREYV